jgi:hypothetical protein
LPNDVRAWVQARVDEAGGVDASRPDGFTQKAWRDLCAHLEVSGGRYTKIRTLDAALKAVAELAKP